MKWIKCSDRLPDLDKEVLCFRQVKEWKIRFVGYLTEIIQRKDSKSWCFNSSNGEEYYLTDVIYWSELPEPPKE